MTLGHPADALGLPVRTSADDAVRDTAAALAMLAPRLREIICTEPLRSCASHGFSTFPCVASEINGMPFAPVGM